jgi:hypothetical protein
MCSATPSRWHRSLAPHQARWGYVVIGVAAYSWLIGAVLAGLLPARALLVLLAALPSALAARELLHHATEPRALAPRNPQDHCRRGVARRAAGRRIAQSRFMAQRTEVIVI